MVFSLVLFIVCPSECKNLSIDCERILLSHLSNACQAEGLAAANQYKKFWINLAINSTELDDFLLHFLYLVVDAFYSPLIVNLRGFGSGFKSSVVSSVGNGIGMKGVQNVGEVTTSSPFRSLVLPTLSPHGD
jgi:hypothetical protein